jgi:hypothetical protein
MKAVNYIKVFIDVSDNEGNKWRYAFDTDTLSLRNGAFAMVRYVQHNFPMGLFTYSFRLKVKANLNGKKFSHRAKLPDNFPIREWLPVDFLHSKIWTMVANY